MPQQTKISSAEHINLLFKQPVLLYRLYCSLWASPTWIENNKEYLDWRCWVSLLYVCSYSLVPNFAFWSLHNSMSQSKDQSNQALDCMFVWKLVTIEIKCTCVSVCASLVMTVTVDDLVITWQPNCTWLICTIADSRGLFLDFALSSNSFHGLLDGLLISQELHGSYRLQVLVQLVHNGDTSGQVQLHDGLLWHTWETVTDMQSF